MAYSPGRLSPTQSADTARSGYLPYWSKEEHELTNMQRYGRGFGEYDKRWKVMDEFTKTKFSSDKAQWARQVREILKHLE